MKLEADAVVLSGIALASGHLNISHTVLLRIVYWQLSLAEEQYDQHQPV